MEKSSKRGKIPQQDWPSIIARYEAGETLASIARTYDCSPPAISYIVSRTRARSAAGEAVASRAAAASGEPQLIKAPAAPLPINGAAAEETPSDASSARLVDSGATEQPQSSGLFAENRLFGREPPLPRLAEPSRSQGFNGPAPQHFGQSRANFMPEHWCATSLLRGSSAHLGGPPQNGEARRTLHLSLQGNGTGSGGDAHSHADSHSHHAPQPVNPAHGSDSRPARPGGGQPGAPQPPRQATEHTLPFGASTSPLGMMRGPAPGAADAQKAREAGAFIDHALRERIDGDIAAFLAAFDAALDHDTVESRTELREATDRLLRAGARTRIELERLEARVPLASRDKDAPTPSLYRARQFAGGISSLAPRTGGAARVTGQRAAKVSRPRLS